MSLRGFATMNIWAGATEYQPITPHSEDVVTASVVDPFGNLLGVMSNPHYFDILAQR